MEQDAKSGPYKTIADSVRQNVDQQFTNLGDGFKKIFSGRYCYTNVRHLPIERVLYF